MRKYGSGYVVFPLVYEIDAVFVSGSLQATVSELWYVEEYDLLALALNGKMKIRKFRFGCSEA